MKLAVLGPCYPFRGGIAHHTTRLVRELRREHEVLFVSYTRQYPELLFPGRSDREPTPPRDPVQVEYLLDSVNPATWWRTAAAMARFRPQIALFPWWVTFWAPQVVSVATAVKARAGAEIVLLCHNVHEHEPSFAKKLITRNVFRVADRFVVQSQQEADKLRGLLPRAAVTVAHHPIYQDVGGPRVDKAEARARLDIDGAKGPVLLFFGFVRPYKGLDLLLDAMTHLPAATLLVVGELWRDAAQVRAQIARLDLGGRVRLVDAYVPDPDVPLYFGAADVVVLPYRSASGSGVAQLALGSSRPMVVTDVGALAEVVGDGVAGRVVPPNDPAALAAAVGEVTDPANLSRFTRAAGERAGLFGWDQLARAVVG